MLEMTFGCGRLFATVNANVDCALSALGVSSELKNNNRAGVRDFRARHTIITVIEHRAAALAADKRPENARRAFISPATPCSILSSKVSPLERYLTAYRIIFRVKALINSAPAFSAALAGASISGQIARRARSIWSSPTAAETFRRSRTSENGVGCPFSFVAI
jgi:hypothetical protein